MMVSSYWPIRPDSYSAREIRRAGRLDRKVSMNEETGRRIFRSVFIAGGKLLLLPLFASEGCISGVVSLED